MLFTGIGHFLLQIVNYFPPERMGLSTLCKSLTEQQSCVSYLTCSMSLLCLYGDELESKEESVANSGAL